MTFLHLSLLPLLSLATLPIILHLLTLHRLKTVELSTFRFLFDSFIQQRRRLRFLEAILAALRTLFVLLIVLVIMRPVVQRWAKLFGGAGKRSVVMLIDASASMNAQSPAGSSLDRAKSAALAIAKKLGPEDRLTLIRLTSKPDVVFTRFLSDADAVRDKIVGLQASAARSNLYAGLLRIFGSESDDADERARKLVYIFTDNQASAWREVKEQSSAGLIPATAQLVVINVGALAASPNRAVIGDVPAAGRAIVGLPVLLHPRVANYSKTEPADVTVGVFINDKEVDRITLSLKPGETARREVAFIPTEPGVLKGRFEIPPDNFPDDDAFLFTLNVVPELKVLLVNGQPASADPAENDGLYLRTALTTPHGDEKAAAAGTTPKPSGIPSAAPLPTPGSIHVEEIPAGGLNTQKLGDANVVILANSFAPDAAALREFVHKGGGLLIFPGDRLNVDQLNASLLNPAGNQPALVQAKLKQPEGDLQKLDRFQKLGAIDFAHPILSVFGDENAKYLSTARFFRSFPIELAQDHAQTWALMQFPDGAPALLESHFGQGIVILAAFPASAKWSNLPLKPEFVPLVLRMIGYVEHRPEFETTPAVQPETPAELVLAQHWPQSDVTLTDPDGKLSQVRMEASGTRMVGNYTHTSRKGYYTFDITGSPDGRPEHHAAAFAVNLAAAESEFVPASQDQVRDWLPGVKLTFLDFSPDNPNAVQDVLGNDREIWRPLIYVMFVVIGVEFVLATLRGTGREERPKLGERLEAINPGAWVGRMTGAADLVE